MVFGGIVLRNVISSIKYKNGKFECDAERGRKATKENINGVVRQVLIKLKIYTQIAKFYSNW